MSLRLTLAVTAAAALLVTACVPVTPVPADTAVPGQTPTAAACNARGGELRPVGRMQTLQCVIKYSDAGKRCTDGDDCLGDCRLADVAARPPEGAAAVGVCQASSDRFGCFTTVENGRAGATLCVD
jgi:putative hemolysin